MNRKPPGITARVSRLIIFNRSDSEAGLPYERQSRFIIFRLQICNGLDHAFSALPGLEASFFSGIATLLKNRLPSWENLATPP